MYVDERSLCRAKYTNFLSVISVSAISSGEILWRIKKNQFEQPFPPIIRLAKTSSRVAPSPAPYESYTKEKKKEKPWMNVNEKMVMVVDNKKYCLIGRLEWTVKNEKAKLLCLMFKMKKSFIGRRGRLEEGD